jgi:hypothetical protein
MTVITWSRTFRGRRGTLWANESPPAPEDERLRQRSRQALAERTMAEAKSVDALPPTRRRLLPNDSGNPSW